MTALDWTSVGDVVEHPVASAADASLFTEGGAVVASRGLRVNRGFIDGLGVRVSRGRQLAALDFVTGAEPVIVIGHGVWRNRFHGDPAVIGRTIRGEPETGSAAPTLYRIVGVLAPGFYFGRDRSATIDLLLPEPSPVRAYMVRLRAGVPPSAAERRITEAARRAATSPIPADWTGVQLESAHERYVGSVRPVLLGVTGAVVLVVVIVCANVAVLMLLRSLRRQREIAVRLALGSARRHIARMLLSESALLCAVALALGLTLTAGVLTAFAPSIEAQLGRPAPAVSGITVDTTVVLTAAVLSVVVALALSFAPLLASRGRFAQSLTHGTRTSSDGPSMRRIRNALIAVEIAGTLVLFVGCGLMLRSVVNLAGTDLGFEIDGLVKSRVVHRPRHYADAAAYRRFHQQFAERISATTGSRVAFSSWPPFFSAPEQLIEPESLATGTSAGTIGVSAGYFSTFGIPVLQGREFTSADTADNAAPVAVLSESVARRLWPDGSALGRRVRSVERTPGGSTPGPWRTVVGIARDVRQTYDDAERGDFYAPRLPDIRYGTFYVRTTQAAPVLQETLKAIAAGIDGDAVVDETRAVAALDLQFSGMKVLTSLLTVFAAVAAFLAALGMYGVTAYAVEQRDKEVAIRVAVGATPSALARMFLREATLVLGVGTVAGVAGAVGVSRALRNQIYGVQSFDPVTYAICCAALTAIGIAAICWPVRRASVGRPLTALNSN
jgi:predicted permease